VHKVTNWTSQEGGIEREMALIKVAGGGDTSMRALRLADTFRARTVDTTQSSFVFEITGAPAKINAFIDELRPLGLIDVSRTGVAAMSRGPEAM
jgi:acetolactate synthase-1/3 small subunit